MNVFLSMAFAVLAWSVYPLITALALEDGIDPFALMFVVQVFATLGAVVFASAILKREGLFDAWLEIQTALPGRAWMTMVVAGAASALSHVFFIMALGMADKGAVSLIFETWPIMAIVATPFMVAKAWRKPDGGDYGLAMAGFAGIALMIAFDSDLGLADRLTGGDGKSFELTTLLGYILTLLAAYLTMVLNLTRADYALHFEPLRNRAASVFVAEAGVRGTASLLLLIVSLIAGTSFGGIGSGLAASAAIGVFIFALGGGMYTYALLNARSPNISLAFYMVPVLAVVWLTLAGESDLNLPMVLGGAAVVAVNIAIFFKNRNQADLALEAADTP